MLPAPLPVGGCYPGIASRHDIVIASSVGSSEISTKSLKPRKMSDITCLAICPAEIPYIVRCVYSFGILVPPKLT